MNMPGHGLSVFGDPDDRVQQFRGPLVSRPDSGDERNAHEQGELLVIGDETPGLGHIRHVQREHKLYTQID